MDQHTDPDSFAGVYTFRVRVPMLANRQAFLWVKRQSFGLNEDDAARELILRIPDAIQLEAVTADATSRVVCARMHLGDRNKWCRYCGQDAQYHPVMSDSKQAPDAERWMDQLRREGLAADGSPVSWAGTGSGTDV